MNYGVYLEDGTIRYRFKSDFGFMKGENLNIEGVEGFDWYTIVTISNTIYSNELQEVRLEVKPYDYGEEE